MINGEKENIYKRMINEDRNGLIILFSAGVTSSYVDLNYCLLVF